MKRLILSIVLIFSVVCLFAQTQVDTKRLIVRDSMKLQTDWFRLTNPTNGQVLTRDNGRWINKNIDVYDSIDYTGNGYLRFLLLGNVVDSVLLNAENITIEKDNLVDHLGTLSEHFAHISPPYVSQGGAITDNGDGTISITEGEVSIKMSNDIDAEFKAVVVPDTTLTIAADQNIIIYIDYNSGSPRYTQRVSTAGYFYQNWDEFPIATVIKISSTKIIINDFKESVTNGTYKAILSQLNYQPIRYLGGLLSSEVGTRQISVSAGAVLHGYDYEGIAGLNTSSIVPLSKMPPTAS